MNCSKKILFIFIRYRCLGNLGHVLSKSEYLNANAGLSFDYQLINVPDFNGVGESQPSPFFYQVNKFDLHIFTSIREKLLCFKTNLIKYCFSVFVIFKYILICSSRTWQKLSTWLLCSCTWGWSGIRLRRFHCSQHTMDRSIYCEMWWMRGAQTTRWLANHTRSRQWTSTRVNRMITSSFHSSKLTTLDIFGMSGVWSWPCREQDLVSNFSLPLIS